MLTKHDLPLPKNFRTICASENHLDQDIQGLIFLKAVHVNIKHTWYWATPRNSMYKKIFPSLEMKYKLP